MDEFEAVSVEPNYITSLALTEAPFGISSDVRFFFRGEQVQQRVNLLLHLIRASDRVALVTAEQGLGKTTLLLQLQAILGEGIRSCQIDANPAITVTGLALQCLQALGVDDNQIDSATDHEMLLQQRCQQLQSLNIKPLLLIDNVDLLSDSGISALLEWLTWQEQGQFLLQAVLTATNNLSGIDAIRERIQSIDIPVLTADELSDYLQHRLTVVGYQGELLFDDPILTQIFRRSQGNPKLINELAHQHLLAIKPLSKSATVKLSSLLKWIGITIFIAFITVLLVFQDKINQILTVAEPEPQPQLDPLLEPLPEQAVTTIIAEPEPEPDFDKQARNELETLLAQLPATVTDPNILEASATSDPANNELPQKPHPKPNRIEQTDSAYQWILQQDSNHYTFQLIGSWDKTKVVGFANEYGLTNDTVIFASKRNGRTWYALLYGVFTTKKLALSASQSWQPPLSTLPRWLRRFDSVQQQINPTNESSN